MCVINKFTDTWYVMISMCCWILFANILLKNYTFIFNRDIGLQLYFLVVSLSSFGVRLLLATYNEFESVFSCFIFWKKLGRININYSLNIRHNSLVKPSSSELFVFVGKFLITDLISLFDIDLCTFWISSSLSFDSYKFLFILNFYCYSITVLCLFSPSLHPTPAEPTSLPCSHPPPWFCPCVLYSSSCNPLFPLYPPHSLLAIVRLFLTSMTLVIFCLLFSSIDYIPVKGEIIWYLPLTTWLISLSIMLSSSIHAVAKGISSFFLSAV